MASTEKYLETQPHSQAIQGPEIIIGSKRIEERLDLLSSRIEEVTKLINLKTEKLSLRLKFVEERQGEITQEFHKKLALAINKSNEMPKIELKIQELLERQNQIIRNFENRMNHFRRTLENQEIQLFKAMSELDESRRELARIKRS